MVWTWKVLLVVGCAVVVAAALNGGAIARTQQPAAAAASTQTPANSSVTAPLHLTSEEAHQREMDALHITSVRPGADGNPDSPRAANYDEAKVPPYPPPPDPLVMNDGAKVTSAKMWWDQRRPQLVELFDREIYGRVPKNVPTVKWEAVSTTNEKNGDVPVITKKLVGHVDNSAYPAIAVNIGSASGGPSSQSSPATRRSHWSFRQLSIRACVNAASRPRHAMPTEVFPCC